MRTLNRYHHRVTKHFPEGVRNKPELNRHVPDKERGFRRVVTLKPELPLYFVTADLRHTVTWAFENRLPSIIIERKTIRHI
jgi:hypothetical protein